MTPGNGRSSGSAAPQTNAPDASGNRSAIARADTASGSDPGVRVDRVDTYVLTAQDTIRGRGTVDGEDRVVVVASDRVLLVKPTGLLRLAVTEAAGAAAPDAEARKRKIAFRGGLVLAGVSTLGSIVAGIIAHRQQVREAASATLDEGDEDGATF